MATEVMQKKHKAYPEYKDSGVEWLGDIPTHWGIKRIKTILVKNDGGVWGEDFDDNGTIVLRSTEQTIDGNWCITEPAKRRLSAHEYTSAVLKEGDLLITKSSGSTLHIGKTSIVTKEIEALNCCYSNFMQRLRPHKDAVPRFLWYVLNGELGRKQFDYLSNTTTGLANLNSEVIGNVCATLPLIEEQRAIASFLDRETERIDALIAKKERQIELLQEKRSALISHAVTKGLNPNAPMKDSGVAWIGKIPAHWEVRKIKSLATKIGSGKTPRGGSEIYVDSGVMLLRSQNIHFDGLRLDDVVFIGPEIDMGMSNTRVQPQDVVLNITGASLGRSCLIPEGMGPSNVNQHVCIIRPRQKDVLPYYLYATICSNPIQSQIFACENGVSREGLNFQQVGNILTTLPLDINEQAKIVEYLNHETERIDMVSAKIKESIYKLREYRTALISAAVTGKIDVRGAT
ncbi:MAG: restriction endonuclease subunit S [Elusimicrobia bacterium]|nr:restriction endonuclease subunit S [Elusimicrobiota bacterium]